MTGTLRAFEAGVLDPGAFDHVAHVEMAHALLRETDFLDAAKRYSGAISALAVRAGKPEKHNLTITLAFLSVIAERMAAAPGAGWEHFIAGNPELLESVLLGRWYSRPRLADPLARTLFLMPDRIR